MKKIVCSLGLFVLIGLVYSNSYAQNLPRIYTESATNRTSSSAALNGRVNPMGTAMEAYFDREKTTGPYENATPRQDSGETTVDVQAKKESIHRAAKLQIPFVQNNGQVKNDNIWFYAKTFHGTFSVTKDGQMVYTLPKRNGKDNASPRGWVIKEKLMGAFVVWPKGEEQAPTRISYLNGSDPSKCKTGLPSYRFLNLGEIYEGIELRLKASGSNIEKLFLVKPDGHPDQIQIQVEGAKAININDRGELELMTDLGPIVFTKPIAYQEISGQKVAVPVMYRPLSSDPENQSLQLSYGFSLGRYDSKYPLVIDPILASTFLGGGGNEDVYALALDSASNVYVTGSTLSPDFPTTPGAYDTTFDGNHDAFVSKFNADLTELLASTFLGRVYTGETNSIVIDSQDNVYVTGHIGGFPAAISKLNNDLTQVLGSTPTIFPTRGNTVIYSIAVGEDGSIYATGFTDDPDFPTTPGAYDTSYNYGDAFVSKFNNDLTQLLASTFLGGYVFDTATAITVDPQGYIVVTGFTVSDDFPTTAGAYDTSFNLGFDVFVSKFNSDLTQLLASTFLGGNDFDRGWAIAVDPQGDIVVGGTTESGNFPTTPGAYKTVFEGGIGAVNGFVSRLSSDLTQLLASTFLGQGGIGFLEGSNRVFVVDNNALEVLNGNLSWLIYSTPVESGIYRSMVIDADGNAYVAGYTDSESFPTTHGAYDTSYNGGDDAFVLKMVFDLPPSYYADEYLPLFPGEIWKYLKNGEQTVTRKVLNNKVKVRGVETSPVKFIEENVTEYLTSDSNGIFLHREYQPHIYISGVGWVDIDATFIPPIKLADGEVWIGQSFHSSGIARTLVLPLGSIFNFNYTADSTIEAEETVTVPAGTFDTIRYRGSITIYGKTLSMTRYLAKGIGIVKDVATNPQGKTATFELVSYLVAETNPPTGSITIKGGAEATKSTAVTLTLTATDDTPGAIRMCISNKATCATWTAFAAIKSWMLSAGNGTKTVNVWFKDMWGNVTPAPYSDTIILDTIAPTNGTLTAMPGDTQVALAWMGFTDAGSGIESYKVVYAKGAVPLSCSVGTVIYSGADLSTTHTGLTNGTKYGYRVCAKDKAGNISTGATASTKPRPELNPPTGSITIKGGAEATKSTAATLTLTASDDGPGAIRMCVSNTATCTTWTAFAATKSWTLTSGNGTKTVNVWFKDVWDNVNPAPYSDTIILDTIAPTNGTVTATPGDTQVALDWGTGFTDGGSGIGSYKVVFAKGSVPLSCSTGTMIYAGSDTSYIHTGLTNGTKYGYRVCAIDKAGNISTGATASTKPRPESIPPTGSITIKGGAEATKSTAVTLTLTASDDTSGPIRMCISNTMTFTTWTAFAPTKSWTLTSGNGTKTVNVWFKDVWDNVNPAPYSDTIILDTIAPANGTVTATPGDTQVALDWGTGFTDGGSGIESYKVVYAKGSVPLSCSTGTMIYAGSDTSYIHTGLTNGTKYGYRVCAIDKAGNISTGATASTKPRPESIPPTGSITIKGGAEATKSTAVTLTLTASDDTSGPIRMCISNTMTFTTWTAFAPTKSWTLTSGNGTKTVNVWFKDVWDNVNATPYSDTIILDTIAPTNGTVTATPGDTVVALDWGTGFTDGGSGIGSYKVVFAKGSVPLSCSTGTMIYAGSDTSYIHTGLTNGTKYGYRVCAIDKAGNISTGATASTKPIP